MKQFFSFLSFITYIYFIIVVIRIILTWLRGFGTGGLQNFLSVITDPYLNWFRRFPALRVGFLDLSPIVALGVLSLARQIFATLAIHGTISIGIILALVLMAVWGAVSFFIIFLLIILILRLIAHLSAQNMEGTFWRIIETISRPVLYRINRFFYKDRIVNFITGLIVSIVCLGIGYIILRIAVVFLYGLLIGLPI